MRRKHDAQGQDILCFTIMTILSHQCLHYRSIATNIAHLKNSSPMYLLGHSVHDANSIGMMRCASFAAELKRKRVNLFIIALVVPCTRHQLTPSTMIGHNTRHDHFKTQHIRWLQSVRFVYQGRFRKCWRHQSLFKNEWHRRLVLYQK